MAGTDGGAGTDGSVAGKGGAGTGGAPIAGNGGAGTGGTAAGGGGSVAGNGGTAAGGGGSVAGNGGTAAGGGGSVAGNGGSVAGSGGSVAGNGGSGNGGPVAGNGGPVAGSGGPVAGNGGPVAGNGGPVAGNGGSVGGNGGSSVGDQCQVTTDCSGGLVCDMATRTCVPCTSNSSCKSGYGNNHICEYGVCISGTCLSAIDCSDGKICFDHSCIECEDDGACAQQYGTGHICISGGCVDGECRTAANCPRGEICTPSFTCTACATDTECKAAYGANHLCVTNTCISGDCRATSDCMGGRVCNTSTYTCVACTDDTTCVNNYGNGHICVGGSCITGTCRNASMCPTGDICDPNAYSCRDCATDAECTTATAYGPGHICDAGNCIPGVCRTSPECPSGGLCDVATHSCHTCSTDGECASPSGYGANHLCVNGACVSGMCHTTADCGGGGQVCNPATFQCVSCSGDQNCIQEYGPAHLCISGLCVPGECRASSDCTGNRICTARTCGTCASDAACSVDPSYGASTVCLRGGCFEGDCHGSSADCPTGQLCGITQPSSCGGCTSDAQCTADPEYGPGNICYQGICQRGDCHGTSADCTGAKAGRLCGAVAANSCGTCATDSQCQADPAYGVDKICHTTTGAPATGTCVSSACGASGACAANASDFCCDGACTPGNCCADADCAANPAFGAIYRCVNHSCTGCAAATGNKFFVDPVNGSDEAATGSGIAAGIATPSCSFKTVTKALTKVVGAPGTQIVIVGRNGQTVTLDAAEALPIVVPANVTITTSDGAIRVNLPVSTDPGLGNVAGFQLGGDLAALAPNAAAPLVIDGGSNLSGIGIGVSPGAGKRATLSNVTVQNSGGHGIAVSNGTVTIGQGVTVAGAGTATKRRDGLNIAGGMVNIAVDVGQAPTSFNSNTQHGIYVTGSGVVNISGSPVKSPAPNGQGTVTANGNYFAGLRIFESPGAGPTSVIDGLVAWGNTQTGLRLYGGAKVKVRNSVFLMNTLNGVFVNSFDATAAGNDLSGIDLGTSAANGRNYLQASVGANPNLAGLCVSMSAGMGTLSLATRGNFFAGPTDCATATTALVRSTVCGGFVDLGVIPAAGTTVTVDVATCQ